MLDHLIRHPMALVHVAAALLALACGTCVILTRKGTVRHRWLGRSYAWSMLVVNVTALGIYELTGVFGPFHWLALVSLTTLVVGYVPALLRHRNWVRVHAYCMASSYVGLLAATGAEIATRIPGWSFGTAATVSSLLINLVGLLLIFLLVPEALDRRTRFRR